MNKLKRNGKIIKTEKIQSKGNKKRNEKKTRNDFNNYTRWLKKGKEKLKMLSILKAI